MPDLDVLARQIGADLATEVQNLFKRLEDDLRGMIAAGAIKGALIDRQGSLVLTMGDGAALNLGNCCGADGDDGEDGSDGADGADGAPGEMGPMGPAGPQGDPGEIGQDGPMGQAGADAPTERLDALAARLDALEAAIPGIGGKTLAAGLIGRDGNLVLGLKDGTALDLGRVVGRDGVDGKDGKDGTAGKDGADGKAGKDGAAGAAGEPGLGFDDIAASLDPDGRTLVIEFVRGDERRAFDLPMPAMIYRGVFTEGRAYVPGDVVTFGGSMWACNTPTASRPGETERAWTLAVKRGRDGKDFAGPTGSALRVAG
jgi:integrin beta 3